MKQAVIDTDTLSYFFRNKSEVVIRLDKYLQEFGFVSISVVTYYEVLNGLYFKDAKSQLSKFEQFVELNEVLPLTKAIAKKAAEIYADLRKMGKSIGHNDILIAATAIINDMTLISNNINHFSRIQDLDLENWSETQ
jgi:tRNA(fMet)-specific endonuclease VapC